MRRLPEQRCVCPIHQSGQAWGARIESTAILSICCFSVWEGQTGEKEKTGYGNRKRHCLRRVHGLMYGLMKSYLFRRDPLFPATRVALGATRHFEVLGLERDHWSNASPIRAIFRNAFVTAGLPYFNPHSFRHPLVQLGQAVCKSPEQFKAWSHNLGHEKCLDDLP
jgi:hypothetical protein